VHPRRKIRDFVGAALAANSHISPKVGIGQVLPVPVAKLPSVQVYTGRDFVDDLYSESPRVEKRILDLRVEVQVDATTAQRAQDLLDDIAEQVGFSVLEDETHGDVAERTEYRETLVSVTAEGDRNLVGYVIGFDVTYAFEYPARDLPAALGIDAGIDIESETVDQIEAEVDLDLDQ